MVQIELTDKELRILIHSVYNEYFHELDKKRKDKIIGETSKDQTLLKIYDSLRHELLERNKNKKVIDKQNPMC